MLIKNDLALSKLGEDSREKSRMLYKDKNKGLEIKIFTA